MDTLERALGLTRSGRYLDALRVIDGLQVTGAEHVSAQVIKGQLLALVGHHGQSSSLARKLLESGKLGLGQRAACENVIGRILLEDGQTTEGLDRVQRAATLSRQADDLNQLCSIQCKLLTVIADRSGRDAAVPLLVELRRNATKLGDPQVSAMVHLYVGEMEGRQGLLASACRHVRLGQELLVHSPNSWLGALAENVLLAACLLRSDVDAARTHSTKALKLAEESGGAAALRSASANTGNLFFLCGDFDRAFAYFERASSFLPSGGEKNNGIIEALAQVRLAQGRLDECEQLLEKIDRTIRNDRDRRFYAHRYAELTRTRLLARQGRISEALQNVEFLRGLCDLTGDQILLKAALLTKAELLQSCGRSSDCLHALEEVMSDPRGHSPETLARYQHVSALGVMSEQPASAKNYSRRAQRICEIATNVPCLLEFERSYHNVSTREGHSIEEREDSNHSPQSAAKNAIHSMATVMLHSSRPELIASEFAELLIGAGCARFVQVSLRRENGEKQVLHGTVPPDDGSETGLRRFVIGQVENQVIELVVSPCDGFESLSTLNMLPLLIEGIHQLQELRLHRERRAALWPVEELANEGLPNEHPNAIISGHMRDLMTSAQRVAKTTVHVLITGESGTGKDILARAIHNFSDRAQKRFVPFNCAAIPRDLLESQLFGHRRGAFTGADRDQVGLVRGASGGTLFLDEIGDMSLDLQPKLLRFLESGEIAPLGEASLAVDVRVVAATNTNLEDAVRAGRFREDLFYRLNVVRLSIKPLRERRDEIPGMIAHFVASAAREFTKGDLQVSEATMERLLLYRWPGNVRQLLNEVRRIVALAEPNSTIEPDAISTSILGALPDLRRTSPNRDEVTVPLTEKLPSTLSRIEYEMIRVALREHQGRVDAAAKALGISRKGLYLKRQRLGL